MDNPNNENRKSAQRIGSITTKCACQVANAVRGFKKWVCRNFGCAIIKYASPGFYHLECKRCGDIFEITSKEERWHERACRSIAMECSLFGTTGNTVNDYREYANRKTTSEPQ